MSASRPPRDLDEAAAEIARLREQLAVHERRAGQDSSQAERIAIVGMGCRYPGNVNTPEAFWDLLVSGRDVLRDIPASRWNIDDYYDPQVSVPGKMYVRQGHYLDDIDKFDPQFFGLSPREAESLDPQQRLVLEVSWEALEHAGIATSSLKGGQTGVFVGQYWDDYSMQRIYATDLREVDRYAQLSGLRGLVAGRIAHILDVHGPAMQVDTACSSASLAVHLACQSLRAGECDVALAGGVSLILAPEHLVGICQMKALSPDGRCKTFDINADGFGQGEGCGMVALKRLSDAHADGDRILAVLEGSAVNHDGHARTVTTPSGPAQRAMLREALRNAGLEGHQLDYVETHGTGTPLGDPIEVMAIARVLCDGRDKPLYMGSVKTNVGHLDAAAGIVGLMKCVLALQHGVIPPHLNFTQPNPRIPWDDWPLEVPTACVPWESERRYAGISAFGMSGTNVHLIVGQAPDATAGASQPMAAGAQILTLSAHNRATLTDVASRYADALVPGTAAELADTCFTAATGRTHFGHRLAVVAETAPDMRSALEAFASGGTSPRAFVDTASRRPPKLAFLFTGQGAQHVGMGRELYDRHPTFRHWLDRCAQLLVDHLDRPLLDVLWSGDELHQTAYTQPALFAVEYALARLWREWGVEPDLLMGHSIGEYAAACVANVFSLEDALALVAARGRLMNSLPGGGEMVSVAADEASVREHLLGLEADVAIAAVNGPRSIVISGRGTAVRKVVAALGEHQIKTTALKVSHAFHSPLMDPIIDEFRAVAAKVDYAAPTTTLISNVTGEPLTQAQLDAEYWVQHLRGAVRFADGIAFAQTRKIETFVEIGPRPTLLGLGRGCVAVDYGTWLPSSKPNAQWDTLAASVAQLHVRGTEIDWRGFHRIQRRKVVLPTYPWRRQRYWTDIVATRPTAPPLHPLVQRRLSTAAKAIVFESTLGVTDPVYLSDHVVFGHVVFPASGFFEMALAAGRFVHGGARVSLGNVAIQQALVLNEAPCTLQVVLTEAGHGHQFEIFSRAGVGGGHDETWLCHASGAVVPGRSDDERSRAGVDVDHLADCVAEPIDIAAFDQRFSARGVAYGPAFQAIAAMGRMPAGRTSARPGVVARLELPAQARTPGENYALHPVLLDASLRVAEALFAEGDAEAIYLPYGVASMWSHDAGDGPLWVTATGTEVERTRIISINVHDAHGVRVAAVDDLVLRPVTVLDLRRAVSASRTSRDVLSRWLYELAWEPCAERVQIDRVQSDRVQSDPAQSDRPQAGAEYAEGRWLILADANAAGAKLAARLEAQGCATCVVRPGAGFAALDAQRFEVDGASRADFERLLASAASEPLAGVVYMWGLDAHEHDTGAAVAALHLLQALGAAGQVAPTWVVTRRAQALNVQDVDEQSVWQAPLWGLVRTLQMERPESPVIGVDLDHDADACELLLDEVRHHDNERQVAYRGGKRHVARLDRLAAGTAPAFTLSSEAAYLVTGGLGALGLEIAEFLVTSGARHLVLSGRSGAATAAQQHAIGALEARGAQVQVVAADMAVPQDVARVLAAAGPTLRGVIHAAGVVDDAMYMQQTAARFEAVAAPKVKGAWQLHQQTKTHPLDFFVLFSSVAAVMGSAGQSNYACANAFMDALAHARRAQGLPALAINWGPWADVGMAATDVVMRRLLNDGWESMTSAQGCEVMAHLLGQGATAQAGVIPIEWARFTQQVPGASSWPWLSRLVSHDAGASVQGAVHSLGNDAKTATPQARPSKVMAYLRERIAQTLRVSAADLDEQAALADLGIDSLTAVELRTWIHSDLAVELAVETMFTTPTLHDLATTIVVALAGDGAGASTHDAATTPATDGAVAPRWIVKPSPNDAASVRLFCFPFAGGGASMYRDWSDAFPHEVELCLVQLPGREERLGEAPITQMSTLIEQLTQAMLVHLDKPFAFLGHSMGAMLAFEVARRLRQLGLAQPQHLFVSARQAPQLNANGEALRFLPSQAFVDKLHELYGAVPEAIRQSPELQAVFLPILKADVTLLETHAYVPDERLSCPITVFGGERDPHISADMLAAWAEQTHAGFTQQQFAGDHFYIVQAKAQVVGAIAEQLLGRA